MEIEVFRNADVLACIFQYVKMLSDIVEIRFDAQRMYFQTMDAAHVSIAEVSIPKEWFEVYRVPGPPVTLGVSMAILHKIVSMRDKDQTICISYVAGKGALSLTIRDGSATKHFEVQLADVNADMIEIPHTEYQAEFTMQSCVLSNIVSQLRMFGDAVTIECCETAARLSSANELGKMAVDVSVDDMTAFSIDEGAALSAAFSLNYLNAFLAYSKISRYVDVKLTVGCPLQLVYLVGPDATVRFFLAPKIDEEWA